jgi:hypothetical protein
MSVAAGNGTTAVTNTVWKTNANIVLATMYGNGSFVLGTAGVAALVTGTIVVPNGGILGGFTVSTQGQVTIATPSVAGATALTIYAGTTSTDSCLSCLNASGTVNFLIAGDGHGSLATGMTWTTQGSFTFGSATGGDVANAAQVIVNNATNGLFINAGTTDGHFPLEINNAGNTVGLAYITGVGRMNLTGSLGIKGATPAITAGQTDIGTTTTVTVITTVGGISLPALASTFWVVNVNGVKYGIPCFAL